MSRCTIVIADDAPDIRMLVKAVLDGEDDLEVVGEAADGLEAIEVVERTQPDVVLLDLSMPRMDGLEALPRLREVAPTSAIVVLSGFLNEDVKSRVLELGATSCVEKGLQVDILTRTVKEAWESAGETARD